MKWNQIKWNKDKNWMINWEDIFATSITDESGKKKKNNLVQKWPKDRKRRFTVKRNTMATKHKKKFLTLFLMKKMRSKLYWDAIFYNQALIKSPNLESVLFWRTYGKQASSSIVDGNEKWCNPHEGQVGIITQNYKCTSFWPRNPTSGKFFWQLFLNMITQISVALFLQQRTKESIIQGLIK